MGLIILLASLALEKWTDFSELIRRFNWFPSYLNFCRGIANKANQWNGYVGLAIAVLPIIAAFFIVFGLLWHSFFNLFGFILALIVFYYCLGPKNFFKLTSRYLMVHGSDDKDQVREATLPFLPNQSMHAKNHDRHVSESTFSLFNAQIFAVSFWFVALGPVGALLYRTIALCAEESKGDSVHASINTAASQSLAVLDWVPTRLLALGFCVVGNFVASFNCWKSNVMSGLSKNYEILTETGLTAIEADKEKAASASVAENKSALALVERTLVAYLVVVALITLGTLY